MKYIINEGIVAKEDENSDLLLVNLLEDDEDVYKLTKVSVDMFKLIQQGKSVDEISSAIEAEYDVAKEAVAKDIKKLIKTLLERKIIKEDS